MGSDQLHCQPVLRDTDAKGTTTHTVNICRFSCRGNTVDIERRTRRKIYHVQLLVHRVFREERNPDAPVVGKGRDGTVRIAPAKGLLEVMKWFLTADFLQRYHVWIYPVDYVSEQGEFALEPLLAL